MKVISSRESKHNGLHRTFSVFFVLLFNSFAVLLWTAVSAMIPLVSTDRAPRKSHESVETEVLDARSLPRLRFLSCQLRLPVTILVSVSRTLLHCRQIYLRASSFREIPRLSLRGYIPISVKRKPQGGRHGVSGWNVFKGTRVFNYF